MQVLTEFLSTKQYKHFLKEGEEIEKFLSQYSFTFEEKKIQVSDLVIEEILNILTKHEYSLVNMLIKLKEYNFIKYSDNPGNDFEEEKEVKILDIDHIKLIKDLEKMGAKKTFEGSVRDIYFDFSDKRLDEGLNLKGKKVGKRSLRIRIKKDLDGNIKNFYTIKRKNKKAEDDILRSCFEKEFEILNIVGVFEIFKEFGLKEYRNKAKNRISYFIENDNGAIKFDIDFYEGIPALLEIEADNEDIAKEYIKKLGFEEKVMLQTGFRGLEKHYEDKK